MLKSRFHSIVAIALIAPLAALSVTPAQAATEDRARIVDHRDLDLALTRDVARLKGRIAIAAEWACGGSDRVTLAERADYKACVTAAKAGARVQADRAEQAALSRALTTARN